MLKDYKYYRAIAQSGDLVLCSGAGKISKAIIASAKRNKKKPVTIVVKTKIDPPYKGEIMFTDDFYYSHIGVIVVIYGHLFIIEANGKTVDLRRFSDAYKRYKGKVHIYKMSNHYFDEIIKVPKRKFIRNLLALEGNKYDWKGVLQQLWNEIKIFAKNHSENNQLYCSELVNLAANYYWGGEEVWVTPHDIGYNEWKAGNFLCELKDIK